MREMEQIVKTELLQERAWREMEEYECRKFEWQFARLAEPPSDIMRRLVQAEQEWLPF